MLDWARGVVRSIRNMLDVPEGQVATIPGPARVFVRKDHVVIVRYTPTSPEGRSAG